MQTFIFFASFLFVTCDSVSLPKYIRLCKSSDPNFQKCALLSGQEAIKHLVTGEKSLRLLPLSPLKLPFVQLENRQDFQLNITDVEVLGLDKTHLVNLNIDITSRQVKTVIFLKEIVLNGQFHADGRILILPIKGDGPGTIRAYGGNYTYIFHYDLVTKKGDEYAKITKDEFSFTVEKAVFNVENVFGKDSPLGKETTKFLNENWIDVVKDFEHVIGTTIGKICNNIASSVFERVPFRDIILP